MADDVCPAHYTRKYSIIKADVLSCGTSNILLIGTLYILTLNGYCPVNLHSFAGYSREETRSKEGG